MPQPTPAMNDWIFSIYGKHPDDFLPGGRYAEPAKHRRPLSGRICRCWASQ
jgi:hypothetical protein